jgi:hypothetical protein
MRAFHNNPALKEHYLAQIRMPKMREEILKKGGWNDGRRDAVGYIIHGHNVLDLEVKLGIPNVLGSLLNSIFLRLPPEAAGDLLEAFILSIKPGADLSGVWQKKAVWLLVDRDEGISKFALAGAEVIFEVAELYRNSCTETSRWAALVKSAREQWQKDFWQAFHARRANDVTEYRRIAASSLAFEAAHEAANAGLCFLRNKVKLACRSADRSLWQAAKVYFEDGGEEAYVEASKRQAFKILDYLRQSGDERVIRTCPYGHKLRLPPGKSGTVRCPVCNTSFSTIT